MTKPILTVCAALVVSASFGALAQSKMAATYVTDEQVKAINAGPGVDRQIISTDIGKLNLAVGIIHRGPTGAAAAAPGAKPAPPPGAAAPMPPEPCGEKADTPPAPGSATGISHEGQTETYIIVSGGGTLITGGHIVNGRKSAPDSQVTRVLNGPSCSGVIGGTDVVKKVVKTGDIIIIPAGVPHGWTDITDHVDYLSVRPDPDRLIASYVNPALKK